MCLISDGLYYRNEVLLCEVKVKYVIVLLYPKALLNLSKVYISCCTLVTNRLYYEHDSLRLLPLSSSASGASESRAPSPAVVRIGFWGFLSIIYPEPCSNY